MIPGFVMNEVTQSWSIYIIKMIAINILMEIIVAVNANALSPYWMLPSVRFGISIQ